MFMPILSYNNSSHWPWIVMLQNKNVHSVYVQEKQCGFGTTQGQVNSFWIAFFLAIAPIYSVTNHKLGVFDPLYIEKWFAFSFFECLFF